jgi:hypothetical protein
MRARMASAGLSNWSAAEVIDFDFVVVYQMHLDLRREPKL